MRWSRPANAFSWAILSAAIAAVPLLTCVAMGEGPAGAPTTAPSTAPATAPTGPPVHIVQKGTLNFDIKADGTFQAAECFELRPTFKAFNSNLTIVAIAPQGKSISKGEVLLELDAQFIHWMLTAAESDVKAAKAAVAKAEADIEIGTKMDALALKQQEDNVRNAEQGLQWWNTVDGPHMLETSDLQLKQAKASADDQGDELDQLKKMYGEKELTSATADIVMKRAVRQLDQTNVMLKMQQERNERTKTFEYPVSKQRVVDGVDGARQQLALTRATLQQTAVNRQATLISNKIGLEQAEKKLADLKEDLANFQVKSPCDGIVEYGALTDGAWVGGDAKALKVGEHINGGQTVLRVITPGKLKVVVPLAETQAFWVEPGLKAKVVPAALPQLSYRAKCGAPQIVPRGSPPVVGFQVTLDPGDVDKRLVPGMKASVHIDAGKFDDALLVPLPAVTAGKVQVRNKEGKISDRSVTVGRTDGQMVEIKSGLSEGDEVVLPGKK